MPESPLFGLEIVMSFVPLRDEPNPNTLIPEGRTSSVYIIPPDRATNPLELAQTLTERYRNASVGILIPGRKFDERGTRHGRGGGWYDHFLSTVPREWLRIGVLFSHHLSSTTLKKEPWDEVMDILAIVTENQVEYRHTNHNRL